MILLVTLESIYPCRLIPYLPPATKLGQGYVFTGVCDSVHRGEYLTRYTPLGPGTPPRPGTQPQDQAHPPPGPGPPD